MRNKYIVAHTGCYSVSQNAWRCFSSSSLWRLAAEKVEQRRDEDISKAKKVGILSLLFPYLLLQVGGIILIT